MIILRMLRMTKKFAFIFLIILLPFLGTAQLSDLKLWTGLALEKDLNKKIKTSVEIEQRLNNNISSFDRLLIEPAISCQISNNWSVELIHRLWYQKTREHDYEMHNRISLGASYGKKLGDFKLDIGSKLQLGLPDKNEDNFYTSKNLVSRNNIRLSYAIFGSRFTPFIKYELFTSLKRFEPKNYQWRFFAGTNYFINQDVRLRLFYAIEHEFNVANPLNSSIFGISLQYSL